MHSAFRRFTCFVATIFAVLIASGNSARTKVLVVEKLATCSAPNSDKYVIRLPNPLNFTSVNNKLQIYGNLTVMEVIQEPLEVVFVTNRCSLDMKTCEPFNKRTLPRICSYINEEKGSWATFFRSFEPDVRCPIKPNVYTFGNISVDLTFATIFALDGYRWQAYLKLFSSGKQKRELLCVSVQFWMKWVKRA
ncbi:uncharacterized protein LOC131678459 [Topomyia yanbarensis]|uniref:uncharacterized protein LOC131678459 n=1 Tax=Topomyia yanbarensis TaxID=2498891 RepID=UPI00273C1650|nr:uncharacterized protein LOC131678459 [Topomyia yanbarensis]